MNVMNQYYDNNDNSCNSNEHNIYSRGKFYNSTFAENYALTEDKS
jgi:hypothetical protein